MSLIRIINPSAAKLFSLNFHPLEIVSRWRDPQLQVSENYSDLKKIEVNCFQILLIDVTFYLYHFEKVVRNVLKKKMKTRIYAAPAVKGLIL